MNSSMRFGQYVKYSIINIYTIFFLFCALLWLKTWFYLPACACYISMKENFFNNLLH